MIRLLQRRLIIPRGDTGSFTVPLLSQGNTDNIAVFTIFDELTRTRLFQKTIQCEGDVMNVVFTHNDTVNLKPGKYLWDIKFYQNPQFVDEELVNGDEVDSYYAGFSLPVCEIRETADNYLVSPDAPTAMLTPEQLDIITGAISSLNEAIEKTQSNVEHYPIVRNEVWYTWDAEAQDYVSTGTRARGNIGPTGTGISSVVLNDDYTLTLNLTDGTSFNSTSIRGEVGNGIDDIVLNNDYTLSIRYTDGEVYTSPSIRGAVGPAGNGIISITKTNTVNNVDTYNINYTNGTFDSFNVTNGRDGGVTSVAGKSGNVILNSGDIEYDEQEVYNSGTVGKEVGDLKSQFDEIITPSPNLYNPSDPDKFNGRIGGSGNPVYDDTLITTGFIPCSYAQIFYATRKSNSSSQRVAMSLNYAYIFDSNKVRIGNAINSPGSSFKITDSTAVYVRFTFYSSFSYPMISLSEDAEYMDYGTFSLDEDIEKNIVDDATRFTYNRVCGSIGVPINMIDGVYSDITVVSGKLVGFASSNDALTNTAKINIITFENGFDKQPTGTKTIYHSFGHCNTIDYSEINGCLILGNGSGDYSLPGKIYIIPKFAEIIENASQGDVLTLSGTNAVIIDCSAYNMGSKFNLVWGELNGRTAQIAYLITAKFGASQTDSDAGDNGTIYRIMLGLGSNNLGKGQFIPNTGNNDFNGTFAILDTYTQSGTNYDTCNQGTCFKNGSIISGIGHSGLWIWKMHTDYRNNGIWYEENKQYLYNPDGSLVSQQGTSGVCVTDNYLIIGQANVGTGFFEL